MKKAFVIGAGFLRKKKKKKKAGRSYYRGVQGGQRRCASDASYPESGDDHSIVDVGREGKKSQALPEEGRTSSPVWGGKRGFLVAPTALLLGGSRNLSSEGIRLPLQQGKKAIRL